MARAVFRAAAQGFERFVAGLPDECWDDPALGEWTVRDLVGHTSRSLVTVVEHARRPAQRRDIADPAGYVELARRAVADSPAASAERGRRAAAALGADPAGAVRELLGDVEATLAVTSDDALVQTFAGGMRLGDYLATRVFELAVHGLDLSAATGRPHQLPAEALAAALELATAVAHRLGHAELLLRALTGRTPLPPGFAVV
jgi:uncharacterized protein (TIGR03083 family)